MMVLVRTLEWTTILVG